MNTARTWNFLLVGPLRGGTEIVTTSINSHPGAKCHGEVFHKDEAVRKAAHEAYYGECKDFLRVPDWYTPGEHNPLNFISRAVFDNPKRKETSIGVRLSYDDVSAMDLYDFIRDKWRGGDFGLVHVTRNPAVCFISRKQAETTGVWHWRLPFRNKPPKPRPVRIEPEDLTTYVREHLAIEAKVRASCEDRLEVTYASLLYDYRRTMYNVFEFIEIPHHPTIAPACGRLPNNDLRFRVNNWAELCVSVPKDVRQILEDPSCV